MQQEAIQGFRMSPQQKRLWLLQRRDGSAYRAQCALRLDGPVDLDLLRNSLRKLTERHEALQTIFRRLSGIKLPVQVVRRDDALLWREIDLSEGEPETRSDELFGEERVAALDLEHGPTARFTLLRFSPRRHVLLITLSSLCADELTLQNLARGLARLCQEPAGERASTEEAIAYVQFSEWQNDLLEGDCEAAGKEFWRDLDLGAVSTVALPLENRSVRRGVFEPRSVELAVEAELAAQISLKFEAQRRSPEIFLLTCWQTLLWRLTGEQEIVVNLHCDGRVYEEMQDALGLYARWAPVRHIFTEGMRFSDAFDQIDRYVKDARGWQEYFSWDRRDVEDDAAAETGPPLSFVYEEWPGVIEAGDLQISLLRRSVCTDPFKLKLSVLRNGPRLWLEFHYDPDFYARDVVERLSREFAQLLKSVMSEMDAPVDSLGLIDEIERGLLVVEWNRTARDIPSDRCLHELFEEQAERIADAVAVTAEGELISYGELNRRANQLGHYLRRLGVGPESRVVLLMERSVEMLVGVLGVLKTGAAYVPLDPAQPESRLAFMLEDARAQALLTQERLRTLLPDRECPAVRIDSDSSLIAQEPEESLGSPVTPDNLAYVIYTSGSMGRPKGVMIEHRSVVNLLHALRETVHRESETAMRVSLNAPLAFDSSIKQVYQLLFGHQVCVAPEEIRRDGAAMLSFIERESVDVLDCAPSQLRLLLEAGLMEMGARAPAAVLVGGEAIAPDLWTLIAQSTEAAFHNLYGPTECTVDATARRISPDSESPTIGRPLANTRIYILDRRLNPVPIGVPGELYIGGAGLSRGYLDRPDLTAERFIPNPFAGSAGDRIYMSGDLARYLGDGEIEFLGRVDHQVKIRGSRVELGEIEVVIREHPDVNESVVVVREDARDDKRLVAYITPANGKAPSTGDLSGFLRKRLPEYMAPGAFVLLNQLPLTPNGKIDRRALPPPEQARDGQTAIDEGASNAIEELLISIFAGVLGRETVGIHDNFFELGGHSLIATQVISRIRRTFHVEAPLRSVFENPTIEQIGSVIETLLRGGSGGTLPPLRPFPRDQHPPLSFAQHRLWFLDQLEGGSSAYNIPAAVRLRGALDVDALKRALEALVSRHEALRTTFAVDGGAPVQAIRPAQPVDLPLLDLSDFPAEARVAQAEQLLREESRQPFDLSHGPLLRVKLFRLGDEDHVLGLAFHHIVFDAWSISILYREMAALYRAFSDAQPPSLPELPIQYADYARWQREWVEGEILADELSYWRSRLEGLAILELPTDHPRRPMQTFNGAHQSFALPVTLRESLAGVSRRENVTLFMILMAAFQTLLYRYTMQEDLSIGTPVSNRNYHEIEGLIGFFLNTLVIRTDLGGEPSFCALLGRVREAALGAYAHQNLPFERLVEELHPERHLNRPPFFQIMFALRSIPQEMTRAAGLVMETMWIESGTAKFDLILMIDETAQGLKAVFEYNTDLFEHATLERMGAHFLRLLEAIAADPHRSISRFQMLDEAERNQLLFDWNWTSGDYPREQCLSQLFESQVDRVPDAVALVFQDEHLTYCELDRRSNRLSHYLAGLGVGPEALVGIFMNRSLEMIYSVLGILKAGGGYVALDPIFPKERLALMLEDSRAVVILTKSVLAERLPGSEALIIRVDEEGQAISKQSEERNRRPVTSDNMAYVTYTSGSTGRPKGIAMPQRAVRNLLEWQFAETELPEGARTLQFASLSFDVSFQDMFSTWGMGGAVVLITEETRQDLGNLAQTLQREAIHRLFIPAVALQQLAEGFCRLESPSAALLKVIAGAEQLQITRSIATMFDRLPACSLHNEYGPSEAHVVTALAMPKDTADWPERPSIGYPILNARIYILDRQMEPVPVAVPGELYIGGAGLARCYLNRPDLVADKFIPDHFGGEAGARLYRTGDLARRLPGGEIEFLGRLDFQVKIRGFRVELGEIETVLGAHPSIKEAVILAREDAPGDKRLVAYVVTDPDRVPPVSELRSFLREKLPEYMIPSAFVFLEILPLTPNGKINRRVLPVPDHARPELERAYLAPRSALEEALAEYWSKALSLERVGVNDNFFELGGHSLLATRLMSSIREDFQVEAPLRSLFEAPTVAGLAERMERIAPQPGYLESVAQALKELRNLSDEEAVAWLEGVSKER